MATVPTQEYATESLQPTQIDPRTASTFGGEIVDLSKGISALGDKFTEIQNNSEATSAEISSIKQFEQIYQKAVTDPDVFNAYGKAEESVQSMVGDVSSKITNAEARNSFQQKLSTQMAVKMASLDGVLKQKQIDFKQAQLTRQYLPTQQKAYWQTNDPRTQSMIMNQTMSKIDENIKDGTIDPDKGLELKESTKQDFIVNQPIYDADLHAEGTEREMLKGKNGMYAELWKNYPDAARDLMPKIHQLAVRQAKGQALFDYVAQDSNEADAMQDIFNGKKTARDLIQDNMTNKYSNEFTKDALDFIASNDVYADKPDEQKQAMGALNIYKMMEEKNPDKKKIRSALMDAVKNKYLDDDEAITAYRAFFSDKDTDNLYRQYARTNLSDATMQKFSNDIEKKNSALTDRWEKIIPAINYIEGYSKNPMVQAKLRNQLFEAINKDQDGDIPTMIAKIIKSDITSNNPGLVNLEDVPNSTMSLKSGFSNVWNINSKAKVNYKIKDGKLQPANAQ